MEARQRLNQIHILGALILAAMVGGVAESWGAFVLAAAALIAAAVHAGDIRYNQPRRSHRRSKDHPRR